MKERKQDIQVLEAIAKEAYKNTGLLAEKMLKEQERANKITSATFEALPRRQRAVFVKELRKQGYTQEEIGTMVGRSQSSISKYEKMYTK